MGASCWVRPAVGVLLLILAGCAPGGGATGPSATATPVAAEADDCVRQINEQVQDVLDAFADAQNAGPAEREAFHRLQDLPPPDCPEWDAVQAADALDEEARQALDELVQSGAEIDAESYAELTGLALVAAALRPAPTFDVPDGFPEEFPVIDGAELIASTRDGDVVTATWEVPGRDFQEVQRFYESALQTMVIGRWTASRSSGSVMQGGGTAVHGRHTYEVAGHGREGTVEISMAEDDDVVTINAALEPEG